MRLNWEWQTLESSFYQGEIKNGTPSSSKSYNLTEKLKTDLR